MRTRNVVLAAGLGCAGLLVVLLALAALVFILPIPIRQVTGVATRSSVASEVTVQAIQEPLPTYTPAPSEATPVTPGLGIQPDQSALTELYDDLNPGVVNIQVYVQQGQLTGVGAGSGFVLNAEG